MLKTDVLQCMYILPLQCLGQIGCFTLTPTVTALNVVLAYYHSVKMAVSPLAWLPYFSDPPS